MQRARRVLVVTTLASATFVWYAHNQQIKEKEVRRLPAVLAPAPLPPSHPSLASSSPPFQRMHAGVLRDIAREEQAAAAAAVAAAAPPGDAACPSGVCTLATKRMRPAAQPQL